MGDFCSGAEALALEAAAVVVVLEFSADGVVEVALEYFLLFCEWHNGMMLLVRRQQGDIIHRNYENTELQ